MVLWQYTYSLAPLGLYHDHFEKDFAKRFDFYKRIWILRGKIRDSSTNVEASLQLSNLSVNFVSMSLKTLQKAKIPFKFETLSSVDVNICRSPFIILVNYLSSVF